MSDPIAPPMVEPTPQPVRIIGLLNIIFGILLMLCGVCAGMGTLVVPNIGRWSERLVEQRQREEIGKIDSQIRRETDDAARARLRARRREVESRTAAFTVGPDLTTLTGLDDRRVVGYYIADAASGLVLNLLLLISGIGLYRLRGWGRRLGIWTAALKLARAAALVAANVLLVVPILAARAAERVEDQAAIASLTASHTITAVGYALIASIYPVIVLWYLTRPGARAACARPKVWTAGGASGGPRGNPGQ